MAEEVVVGDSLIVADALMRGLATLLGLKISVDEVVEAVDVLLENVVELDVFSQAVVSV